MALHYRFDTGPVILDFTRAHRIHAIFEQYRAYLDGSIVHAEHLPMYNNFKMFHAWWEAQDERSQQEFMRMMNAGCSKELRQATHALRQHIAGLVDGSEPLNCA